VEGVPAHGRGVRTRQSLRSLPIQSILQFYDIHEVKKIKAVEPLDSVHKCSDFNGEGVSVNN